MILLTPWTSQPQYLARINPYWVSRGLVLVSVGNKVVYNTTANTYQNLTTTGTPKSVPSKIGVGAGVATGFGATLGAGATDRLGGLSVPCQTAFYRSIVAHVFVNAAGGGGLGRVIQPTTGTGVNSAGESIYIISGTKLNYARWASTAISQHTSDTAQATARWSVFGVSHDQTSMGTTPLFYVDGDTTTVTTNQASSGAYTGGAISHEIGNRASDGLRNWDGLIGPILWFDGFLTAEEHKSLAINPWQVFANDGLLLFAPTAAGGTAITGALGTAVASGLTGTVNANRTLAGTLGTATASGFQGGVNANRTISGALGTAVASGLAGNVNANRTIAGTLGTATASGFQGTVTNDNSTTITGALGTAAASGFTGGVSWNRYIAGVLGVATASGFTGGVVNGTAVAGRRRTSTRKILVTVKGARFQVPEDQLDQWLEKKEDEIVAQAVKPVALVTKKARIIRPNTLPIPKVSANVDDSWVQGAIAALNQRVLSRIMLERKRAQDEDDEEVMLLLL